MRLLLILLVATNVMAAKKKEKKPQVNSTAEALGCVNVNEGTLLVLKKEMDPKGKRDIASTTDGKRPGELNLLQDLPTCEMIVSNAREGLYCRYHHDGTTLEKDAKQLKGWFPTSLKTGKGVGPCPVPDLKVCLDVVAKSANGMVCTNSCSGWTVTNSVSRELCGGSVSLDRCLKASEGAIKNWVCSYTGDGDGGNNQWVPTKVSPKCTYEGSHQSLEDCKTTLLKK